jgi:hypothetical protein
LDFDGHFSPVQQAMPHVAAPAHQRQVLLLRLLGTLGELQHQAASATDSAAWHWAAWRWQQWPPLRMTHRFSTF